MTEALSTDHLFRLGAALFAAAVLLGAGVRPARYLWRSVHPWAYLALFGVSLLAAFILTLVTSVPLLRRLSALIAVPEQTDAVLQLLARIGIFAVVCGALSLLALKGLARTRFLNFLPVALLKHAALIVTASLLLFALAGI